MFFFSILFSGFPDLGLGILKMPIRVCLHDVLQPAAVYLFVPGVIWIPASFVK